MKRRKIIGIIFIVAALLRLADIWGIWHFEWIGKEPWTSYFGVFLVFVLAIGQVTPPVGLCLFVACDMAKTTIESVSKEVIPYIIGLVAVAVLLIFAPQIIMWLPGLAGL